MDFRSKITLQPQPVLLIEMPPFIEVYFHNAWPRFYIYHTRFQKRYKSLYKPFKFLSRKKKAAPEPRRSPCFEFNFF